MIKNKSNLGYLCSLVGTFVSFESESLKYNYYILRINIWAKEKVRKCNEKRGHTSININELLHTLLLTQKVIWKQNENKIITISMTGFNSMFQPRRMIPYNIHMIQIREDLHFSQCLITWKELKGNNILFSCFVVFWLEITFVIVLSDTWKWKRQYSKDFFVK